MFHNINQIFFLSFRRHTVRQHTLGVFLWWRDFFLKNVTVRTSIFTPNIQSRWWRRDVLILTVEFWTESMKTMTQLLVDRERGSQRGGDPFVALKSFLDPLSQSAKPRMRWKGLRGHTGCVNALAFSSLGNHLYSGGDDQVCSTCIHIFY